MNNVLERLDDSWKGLLADEFRTEYFQQLWFFLSDEYGVSAVCPPMPLLFAALERTPAHRIKAVIIGQDPYHGPGQANGLCFSVTEGIRHPPSLRNIFKELNADLNMSVPVSGDLSRWADQGVLLLNATLSVRAHEPGSHQGRGWERLTDAVIARLSEKREGIVFMLWGNFAQQKEQLIAKNRGHLILKAAHPSPFSAHRGFFGCKHFSKVNTFLRQRGELPIDWSL
jgi:uracil-DNA glycosylase